MKEFVFSHENQLCWMAFSLKNNLVFVVVTVIQQMWISHQLITFFGCPERVVSLEVHLCEAFGSCFEGVKTVACGLSYPVVQVLRASCNSSIDNPIIFLWFGIIMLRQYLWRYTAIHVVCLACDTRYLDFNLRLHNNNNNIYLLQMVVTWWQWLFYM